MRISSSNLDMYSDRTYSMQNYEQTLVNGVVLSQQLQQANEQKSETLVQEAVDADVEKQEEEAKPALADTTVKYVKKIPTLRDNQDAKTIKQRCIQYLLDILFVNRERIRSGKKVQSFTYQEWLENRQNRSVTQYTKEAVLLQSAVQGTAKIQTVLSSSKTCYFSEQERTAYQTKGSVVTADGRQIEFNLQFAMSRSFEKYYNERYETSVVSFCDPLVINLDSTMPEVSDQKFLFDIDADGVLDTISKLSGKSGYLAIDKNNDGIVNDGSELFGTKSGDGFADLAQYDSDKNGWIDEADDIWKKLMIWTEDENGKAELYHISEKGIGAICLANTATDFSLNSLKTNQTNAMVRSTGIFLYENGGVGTVQHMDLAV